MTKYKNNEILKVEWLSAGIGMSSIGYIYCRDVITDKKRVYIGAPMKGIIITKDAILPMSNSTEGHDIRLIIDRGTKFEMEDFNKYLEILKFNF